MRHILPTFALAAALAALAAPSQAALSVPALTPAATGPGVVLAGGYRSNWAMHSRGEVSSSGSGYRSNWVMHRKREPTNRLSRRHRY